MKKSSLIIDATDDWESMKTINKYCVTNSIPLISTAVVGFDSQVALFYNQLNKHLCLQCLFPNNKEAKIARCDSIGVLATAAGIAGIIAAQKTINFFIEKKLENIMTIVDIKSFKINNIKIKKNLKCRYSKKNNQT